MGKTRRKASYRDEDRADAVGRPRYVRRIAQPAIVTPEWVVRQLRGKVNYAVDGLVRSGLVGLADKPDWINYINDHIRRYFGKYDPERRNRDGKTCSAVHYFGMVVDCLAMNIRKYQEEKMKTHLPITEESEESAARSGMVSTEGRYLSDDCRSVRELWFRMDLAELRLRLDREQRTVLRMRLEDYTFEEIAERLGCDRDRIRKTVMPKIQKVARKLGFIPRSDVEARASRP